MALVATFTTPAETFPAGRTLRKVPDLTIELDRVVPTGETIVPYMWVLGTGHDAFEVALERDPGVTEFRVLAETDGGKLYQLDWVASLSRALRGLFDLEFTLLSGIGTADGWEFQIRFPDTAAAGRFHDYITEVGIPHDVSRIRQYTGPDTTQEYGLTADQRDALLLAWRHGYFAEPRQTTLAEIADRLGISVPAVSGRLQRGSHNLIAHTLGPGD